MLYYSSDILQFALSFLFVYTTARIQYKLWLLVHKMFVRLDPDYIASLLTPASDISSV